MKYRTFHAGLLAFYDEEPKRLPKFGGLVHISPTRCQKIGGTESLEEIRYILDIYDYRHTGKMVVGDRLTNVIATIL